jgi:hypothetical protein
MKEAAIRAWFGLLLDPEDGGHMFLERFGLSPNYAALQPKTLYFSYAPLWKPLILYLQHRYTSNLHIAVLHFMPKSNGINAFLCNMQTDMFVLVSYVASAIDLLSGVSSCGSGRPVALPSPAIVPTVGLNLPRIVVRPIGLQNKNCLCSVSKLSQLRSGYMAL